MFASNRVVVVRVGLIGLSILAACAGGSGTPPNDEDPTKAKPVPVPTHVVEQVDDIGAPSESPEEEPQASPAPRPDPLPSWARQSTTQRIAAGDGQTCELVGGTLECWGRFGAKTLRNPKEIETFERVYDVTGDACVIADREEAETRAVYCADPDLKMQEVTGAGPSLGIDSAGEMTCSALESGAVVCWNRADPSSKPRPVAGIDNAVGVAVGHKHVCALNLDRTVQCWGDNASGQLATGDTDPREGVVAVPLPPVDRLFAGANHTCAQGERDVVCWGGNDHQQCGAPPSPTVGPTVVKGLDYPGYFAVGDDVNCYIASAGGALRCWGSDALGLLENGGKDSGEPITPENSARDATDLGIGRQHGCGVDDRHITSCWGTGRNGLLPKRK